MINAPAAGARQPTVYTQAAAHALHAAIANEPEPDAKLTLSKALQIVLAVQAKNMREGLK